VNVLIVVVDVVVDGVVDADVDGVVDAAVDGVVAAAVDIAVDVLRVVKDSLTAEALAPVSPAADVESALEVAEKSL